MQTDPTVTFRQSISALQSSTNPANELLIIRLLQQQLSVLTSSLIWTQTTDFDILYHFALRVLRPAASLDADRWWNEMATVRCTSLHQKSVSEVGTFDRRLSWTYLQYLCSTEDKNSDSASETRLCPHALSLNINSNYWTHHTFLFYETKMF